MQIWLNRRKLSDRLQTMLNTYFQKKMEQNRIRKAQGQGAKPLFLGYAAAWAKNDEDNVGRLYVGEDEDGLAQFIKQAGPGEEKDRRCPVLFHTILAAQACVEKLTKKGAVPGSRVPELNQLQGQVVFYIYDNSDNSPAEILLIKELVEHIRLNEGRHQQYPSQRRRQATQSSRQQDCK